jgi:hypothetical protein
MPAESLPCDYGVTVRVRRPTRGDYGLGHAVERKKGVAGTHDPDPTTEVEGITSRYSSTGVGDAIAALQGGLGVDGFV